MKNNGAQGSIKKHASIGYVLLKRQINSFVCRITHFFYTV